MPEMPGHSEPANYLAISHPHTQLSPPGGWPSELSERQSEEIIERKLEMMPGSALEHNICQLLLNVLCKYNTA